jgi:L-amino acid N-acyltransferase YncA
MFMDIIVRGYILEDLPAMTEIWNQVVEEANAFPQTEKLSLEEAKHFFSEQTFTGVAVYQEEVVGLYILHPNNIGRCGHIANASYAVSRTRRGMKIGERLVRHSLSKAKEYAFRLMQFNAVVSINHKAIHLYEKIGFTRLGVIPKGFRLGDGSLSDIILYYIEL